MTSANTVTRCTLQATFCSTGEDQDVVNHHVTVTFPRPIFFQIVSYSTGTLESPGSKPTRLQALELTTQQRSNRFDHAVVPARPVLHVDHDLNDNKMNPIREHVEGKWNHVQRLEAVSPTVSWQNPTGIQSWRENVHVTEPKSLVATPKHCIITLQCIAMVYFRYSSGWNTNKPLVTRFSCLANLLACELIIPQQTLHKVRETPKGLNNYST